MALGVVIAYNQILRLLYPNWKPGQQDAQTTPAPAPGPQSASQPAGGTTATGGTGTGAGTVSADLSAWSAKTPEGAAPATQPTILGSAKTGDTKFTMAVRLSDKGAAIEEVILNGFDKSAKSEEERKARYTFQQPYSIDGNVDEASRSMLTRSVLIDRNEVALGNVAWKLESADASSAKYSVDIYKGKDRVARVVKIFQLSPRSDEVSSPRGYQLSVIQRVENVSENLASIGVINVLNGPTTPPREMERQPDQNIILGYWDLEKGAINVASHTIQSEFGPEHFAKEWTKNDKGHVAGWVGQQSAYFNAVVRPVPFDDNGKKPAEWLYQIGGDLLNRSAKPDDFHVSLKLVTASQDVAKGQGKDFNFEVYFGPKSRNVLHTGYYAGLPRSYDETLVVTSGMCSSCTWNWLINGLVMLLGFFHMMTRDWGVAIILLVVLVRALLHPITKKSQVHMVKMQKMGPELEKLKKKHAEDKEALAKAQMQFYKEQGFAPVLGCLPMFLQMPIWIALWNSLQSTFELRAEPFLYGLTWIKDLAQPDYLIRFAQPYHFLFFTISGLNILPLGLAVVFYLQSKLQPKPAAATPEQAQQQKMMVWMSTLMFPLLLYSGPSGLNLYILTSTAFGIVESKVIRKHIKEREELEALRGPTIVDGPAPEKSGKGSAAKEVVVKKGWLARLQDKAEELRNQQDKDKRGR